MHQAGVDDGLLGGTTSSDAQKLKELEQEVKELRRANAILRKASAFMSIVRLCRFPARAMTFDLFGAGER